MELDCLGSHLSSAIDDPDHRQVTWPFCACFRLCLRLMGGGSEEQVTFDEQEAQETCHPRAEGPRGVGDVEEMRGRSWDTDWSGRRLCSLGSLQVR